ncbi:hypothetical protein SASPL_111939 [Salvia splendens]|uniref:SWIM-type domain-containing protein n=1 Tax=Salvia splendens TaxID=180675 RepID=A0A8X9A443_SALSN|nr:hypothetical protein SASPL_111939 [Salvia splendens]
MDHIDEIDIIDWDNIEIIPLEESQIGPPENLMDGETMSAFVGLTLEKPSDAVERMNFDPIIDEIMDITVDDHIPNEEIVFHDMEDPPMDVGTIYANMNDFRRAVKQHAKKTQFELVTEKSNPNLFRGFCKAKTCPWSIVARLMKKEKHAEVILNKGRFENLFNFKAMVELKMPGSVVEIGLKETEDGVYLQRFFCCFKPSINGFINGCRPYSSVDATTLNGRWNGQLASTTALDGHNWIFPVAFGLFESETNEEWIWFMEQLKRAIGSPPHIDICSDACEVLENALKAVFPLAEHRECFLHLMKDFSKRFQEVWNKWMKDFKDCSIAELVDSLRSKFMELYARRRNIGKAEVTEITDRNKVIRHVVDLEQHTCSCREWQVSGKPCSHALAVITSRRNPKMVDYLQPYFSVSLFSLAYAGVISPFPDKSQWPSMNLGFKVLPPLLKRAPGRPRKNRITGCLEGKGNKSRTKGMWQVQCNQCKEFGHRESSAKCVFNETKKRKSRAKERTLGGMHASTCQRQGQLKNQWGMKN